MAQAIAAAIGVIDVVAVVCAVGMVFCAVGYVNSVHEGSFVPRAGATDSANIAGWVSGFAGWIWGLLQAVGGGLTIAVTAVIGWVMSPLISLFNQVRYSWLPWVLHQAAVAAGGLVTSVYNALSYDIHAVEGALQSEIGAVEHAVAVDINAVESAVQGEIAQVWTGIEVVERDTQAALRGIEQGVDTALGTLEHVTEISLQNLEAGVEREITQVAQGAEAQIGGAVRGLEGQLQGVESWVQGLLGATVLPGLAALGLGLRALEQEVAQTNETCVNPLCRNLGGLSNVLGLLGQLGLDGLLLALLAELLRDPAGVAAEVNQVAVPIVRGAGGAVLSQAA